MDLARWGRRLRERADLGASYREVASEKGAWPETLRGRVRLFQMRLNEAVGHIAKAAELYQSEKPSLETGLRIWSTAAYCRESRALTRGTAKPPRTPMIAYRRASGRFRRIVQAHLALDAQDHIRAGESSRASEIYSDLLRDLTLSPEGRTLFSIGLAAASYNLGLPFEGHVRTAERSAGEIPHVLGRSRAYSSLESLWRLLGDVGQARAWQVRLYRLHCPADTVAAMRLRARVLREQSVELGCVVV